MPDTTNMDLLDPYNVLRVNKSPMQEPGRDEKLRTATVGGPALEGDRRVFLSADLLGRLLEIARSSPMGRVQVDRAGVQVDLYRRPDGHCYEVWTLIGADPRPEQMPSGFQQFVERTKVDR